MALLTTSGRIAVASLLITQPWHLAWGSGNADWDVTPVPESADLTTLTAEIGRLTATQVAYCTPDVQGELYLPSGRHAFSALPTRHLYFHFNFEDTNAPESILRESGLFIGTVPITGLPPGQRFFTPDQIQTPGTLFLVEHFPKIIRTLSTKQVFEFALDL